MKRRAKGTTRRKATTFVVNDENVDPDEGLRGCKDGDAMEVDENQDRLQTTTFSKKQVSAVPTERKVVGNARPILSPTKFNGEARVSVSPQSSFLPLLCHQWLRIRILKMWTQNLYNYPPRKRLDTGMHFPRKFPLHLDIG